MCNSQKCFYTCLWCFYLILKRVNAQIRRWNGICWRSCDIVNVDADGVFPFFSKTHSNMAVFRANKRFASHYEGTQSNVAELIKKSNKCCELAAGFTSWWPLPSLQTSPLTCHLSPKPTAASTTWPVAVITTSLTSVALLRLPTVQRGPEHARWNRRLMEQQPCKRKHCIFLFFLIKTSSCYSPCLLLVFSCVYSN